MQLAEKQVNHWAMGEARSKQGLAENFQCDPRILICCLNCVLYVHDCIDIVFMQTHLYFGHISHSLKN